MKIKRPLFIFSFSILVVIYVTNTMPERTAYVSLALFALFTVIHRFTENRYTKSMILAVAAAVAGLLYMELYKANLSERITELESESNIVVQGVVTAENRTSSGKYYTISVKSADNRKYSNFGVTVYTDVDLNTGDSIEMTGKYKSFTPKSNYLYNYGKGVFGYFYPDEIECKGETGLFYSISGRIRRVLYENARNIFSYDTVGIALAMGMGNKTYLSDKAVNAFNFTGISHTLVVSGLHVGFIVLALTKMLQYIPVSRKIKNFAVCIFIFTFMGIIGFTPSIIRAGCLVIVMLLGRNLFLETDNYTTLAVVILVTLLLNPYSAMNASLLLSYSAYFGVIHAAETAREKGLGNLLTGLLMSAYAVLFTAPVMSVLGMDVTLLSPVFNLLLSPVVMIICLLSFFLPVLYSVPLIGKMICSILAPFADFFIRILLHFTGFVAEELDFAMVSLGRANIRFSIFCTVVIVVVSYIQIRNKTARKIVILTVSVFSFLCYNYMNRNIFTVKIFDGSSEPSYIISSKDTECLVMTEKINESRFKNTLENIGIEYFDKVIYCPEKYEECEYINAYTDNVIIIDSTCTYKDDSFVLSSEIEKRSMAYVIDISGVKFVFNHKKTDLSEYNGDFYFFGSDTPKDVNAENCFYFYPVIKANVQMVSEKEATELYGVLTVKINQNTGRYTIVRDVKNFGSQL